MSTNVKVVKVGYFLKNDTTDKTRAPSASEMNHLIANELQSLLTMYSDSFTIRKEGAKDGEFVLEFRFSGDDDEVLQDFLLDPDDDGNYAVGDWGWHATLKRPAQIKRAKSPQSPRRKLSPSPKRHPQRCPNGYRRNRATGKCLKH